jgi:glycine/D-amino acid oxidase-like deaminating enzyme
MLTQAADIVICGAGLAGISAAYHLALRQGLHDVLLVDERAPLSLTSDKSSECYRNWWPGIPCAPDESAHVRPEAMVRLMDRSIDILEILAHESGNAFRLNRRGYLYATGDPARIPEMQRAAEGIARLGAGSLRCHTGRLGEPAYAPAPPAGFEGQPAGADLITDPAIIRQHFPYLSQQVVAALHVRRAGWLSAQQLGMYLLEKALGAGVRMLRARVTGVEAQGGRVQNVCLETEGGGAGIATRCFVNAAGPLCAGLARTMGVDLPISAELHAKVTFHDVQRAVPRTAPLLIWDDAQRLVWDEEERAAWAESEDMRWLLDELPGGAHTRPDGPAESDVVMMLWPYHARPVEVAWPLAFDPAYAEVTLRGIATLLPAAERYLQRLPRLSVDGGYYMRTPENRPLIGPLPVEGAYVIGALSGFGVMASCAAGELLAAHVAGSGLPDYAPAFRLERYENPIYRQAIERPLPGGQL